MIGGTAGADLQRFMDFVMPVPECGCWLWTGGDSGAGRGGGYGRFTIRGRSVAAHRWAYAAFVGRLRRGAQVDHKCRLRCCVNPDHLEQVSHRENQRRRDKRRAS